MWLMTHTIGYCRNAQHAFKAIQYTSLGEDRLFYADFSSQTNNRLLWHFYYFQLWRLPVLEVSGLDWTPFHSFQEFWFEHLHLPDLFP